MSAIDRIYKAISPVSDTIVDQAMAQALPTARPVEQKRIVSQLLERGYQPALVSILELV